DGLGGVCGQEALARQSEREAPLAALHHHDPNRLVGVQRLEGAGEIVERPREVRIVVPGDAQRRDAFRRHGQLGGAARPLFPHRVTCMRPPVAWSTIPFSARDRSEARKSAAAAISSADAALRSGQSSYHMLALASARSLTSSVLT